MKISSLEKKLKTIGSKLEDNSFVINSKKVSVLKSQNNVFGFAYNQGEDDSIIFDTFSQVQQHFNY